MAWTQLTSETLRAARDQLNTEIPALEEGLNTHSHPKLDAISAEARHFAAKKPTAYLVSGISLTAGATYTSGDIRGTTGLPTDILGAWLHLFARSESSTSWADLYADSADTTPDGLSARLKAPAPSASSMVVPVTLGTGANAGKFKLAAQSTVGVTGIFVWAVAYWR